MAVVERGRVAVPTRVPAVELARGVDPTQQDEDRRPDRRHRPADRTSAERNHALDGVRFVAVAAVLAFHFRVPGAQAGFLGVDLFFVLSGFLITWVLLKQVESGRVRLVDFWTRRVRRLAPAIVLALAAMIAWGALEASMTSRDALRGDITATLAYIANWHFIDSSSYFLASGDESPLLHMWTLAVEEQFYVLWPVALFLVALAVPRRSTSGGRCRRGGIRCSPLRVEALCAVGRLGNVRSGVHGHRLAHVRSDGRRPARHRAHARPAPGSVPLAEHRAHGRGLLGPRLGDVRTGVGGRAERDVPAGRRAALRPGFGGGHLGPVDAALAGLRDSRAGSHRVPRPYLVRHLHLALAAHCLGG